MNRRLVAFVSAALVMTGCAVADTWIWNGQAWSLVSAESAPGTRVNAAGAFHTGLGRVLMAGGGGATGTLNDLWGWDGTTWTRIASSGQPTRQAHGLAYDAARQRLVLTGGLDQPGTAARHQDVWEWDGTTWTNPA